MQRLTCGLIVGLACFLASEATADSLTVNTDTTWRSIGPVGDTTGQPFATAGQTWQAANIGWNTSLAFDDSGAGWHNAIQPFLSLNPLIIWPDGNGSSGSSPAYFRKVFTVPGTPTAGTLRFGVDDDAVIYINGAVAYSDINGLATNVSGIDITGLLQGGNNLIAVKAHNMQLDNGFDATLNVTFVPEPSTLLLALAGVLVVFHRVWPVRRRLSRMQAGPHVP